MIGPKVRGWNMISSKRAFRTAGTFAIVVLYAGMAAAQGPSLRPIVSDPKEALTVNPGFRDWAPAVIAGTTIIGGN